MKRSCPRYILRLPVLVCAGCETVRGCTVRISRKGMFVRTRKGFRVGVSVELFVFFSAKKIAHLQGVVRYVRRIGNYRIPLLSKIGFFLFLPPCRRPSPGATADKDSGLSDDRREEFPESPPGRGAQGIPAAGGNLLPGGALSSGSSSLGEQRR